MEREEKKRRRIEKNGREKKKKRRAPGWEVLISDSENQRNVFLPEEPS